MFTGDFKDPDLAPEFHCRYIKAFIMQQKKKKKDENGGKELTRTNVTLKKNGTIILSRNTSSLWSLISTEGERNKSFCYILEVWGELHLLSSVNSFLNMLAYSFFSLSTRAFRMFLLCLSCT